MTDSKWCPVLMVLPGTMSKKDIARMERKGGILVVECQSPEDARFADAPSHLGMDAQARAAMHLLRYIAGRQTTDTISAGYALKVWVNAIVDGTNPPTVPPVKKVKP